MAIRILFIILSIILFVNLVLVGVSFICNVNLYKKYGKQILNFFIGIGLFVICAYIVIAIIGLV